MYFFCFILTINPKSPLNFGVLNPIVFRFFLKPNFFLNISLLCSQNDKIRESILLHKKGIMKSIKFLQIWSKSLDFPSNLRLDRFFVWNKTYYIYLFYLFIHLKTHYLGCIVLGLWFSEKFYCPLSGSTKTIYCSTSLLSWCTKILLLFT
mgnify:CR=1 FL=1